MKEFLIGSLIGTAAGLIVGGVMVAKNKQLSNKINDGTNKAQQKIQELKDSICQKLKGCECGDNSNNCQPECDPNSKICS